jgi:predicted dehydrogenase
MSEGVLIVGAGYAAQHIHLPYWHLRVPNILVCDINPQAATAAARNAGGQVYEGLVEDAPVGTVVITTPPTTHATLAGACLRAGKNVIVEKPLATSAAEAADVVAAAARSGRLLHACYTSRWRPEAAQIAGLIISGELGEVAQVETRWQRNAGRPRTAAAEAGVLWDLGAHLIDLAVWMTGWKPDGTALARSLRLVDPNRPKRSAWYADSAGTDTGPSDDTLIGHVYLRSGIITVWCSWSAPVDHDEVTFTLTGTRGVLRWRTVLGFSPDRQTVPGPCLVLERPGEPPCVVRDQQPREPIEYVRQFESFGAEPTSASELSSAVASVMIGEALDVSQRTHDPQRIGDALLGREPSSVSGSLDT